MKTIAYYWGVSRSQVEAWRRAPASSQTLTAGTAQLWKGSSAPVRLGDPKRWRGGGSWPPKVSDADIRRIRARATRGERAAELWGEMNLTRQYVGLIIAGRRRPQKPRGVV